MTNLKKHIALEVVWRNPTPPSRPVSYLEKLELDEGILICIVRSADARSVFELVAGGLASSPLEKLESLGGA